MHKSPKKRGHTKSSKKSKSKNPLSEALSDLSKEIRLLAEQRRKIEEKLSSIKKDTEGTHEVVSELKNKLNKLESLETNLIMKKSNEEHKLSDIRGKLEKVRKARETLSAD